MILIGAFYISSKKTFSIVLLLQIRIIKLTFDVLVKVNMQKYQKASNNFFFFLWFVARRPSMLLKHKKGVCILQQI